MDQDVFAAFNPDADALVRRMARQTDDGAFDYWSEPVGALPNHWLLRTTHFDMHRDKWIALGAELAAYGASGPRGEAVRAIGQRLSGQEAA